MSIQPRYQVSICRGEFRRVREIFREWKHEPLVYRRDQTPARPMRGTFNPSCSNTSPVKKRSDASPKSLPDEPAWIPAVHPFRFE
jgi:hypothetical protein